MDSHGAFSLKKTHPPALKTGECGMIFYENNTHSPIISYHHWFTSRFLVKEFWPCCNNPGIESRLNFIFILIGLQSTFQIDQASFLEILLTNFTQLPPGLDVDPFCVRFYLAVFAFPAVADSGNEICDFLPLGSQSGEVNQL